MSMNFVSKGLCVVQSRGCVAVIMEHGSSVTQPSLWATAYLRIICMIEVVFVLKLVYFHVRVKILGPWSDFKSKLKLTFNLFLLFILIE